MKLTNITKCRACGGTSLTWDTVNRVRNGIQQNRLNTNDVACVFFLGCDQCSETLALVSADRVAVLLNADAKQQPEVERLRESLACALKSAENINAEAVALRTQLSEHQWHYEPYDDHYHRDAGHYCPSCGGEQGSGHKEGCEIAAALSLAPRAAPATNPLPSIPADSVLGLMRESIQKIGALSPSSVGDPNAKPKWSATAKPVNPEEREAFAVLLDWAESQICHHEETHRGGAIWEICDLCGEEWADDRGGKPEFKWPDAILKARAVLEPGAQEITSVDQLGADADCALCNDVGSIIIDATNSETGPCPLCAETKTAGEAVAGLMEGRTEQ